MRQMPGKAAAPAVKQGEAVKKGKVHGRLETIQARGDVPPVSPARCGLETPELVEMWPRTMAYNSIGLIEMTSIAAGLGCGRDAWKAASDGVGPFSLSRSLRSGPVHGDGGGRGAVQAALAGDEARPVFDDRLFRDSDLPDLSRISGSRRSRNSSVGIVEEFGCFCRRRADAR